jgi:hypothetical protein
MSPADSAARERALKILSLLHEVESVDYTADFVLTEAERDLLTGVRLRLRRRIDDSGTWTQAEYFIAKGAKAIADEGAAGGAS